MDKYTLSTVSPKLVKFLDNLTNTYIRSNKSRFKGDHSKED